MRLVERHQITRNHRLYDVCDKMAFQSKNLYNAALYVFRQSYFAKDTTTLSWVEINKAFVEEKQDDYVALHSKVANATMKQLGGVIASFWGLKKSEKVDNVQLPKYLHKTNGRFVVKFNNQTIAKKRGRNGELILCPQTDRILVPTRVENPIEVRIVPKKGHYVIEVVYEEEEKEVKETGKVAAIDLGINNLATVVFNGEYRPLLISGRHIKSINQYYNKKTSKAKSLLPKNVYTSKRLDRLWTKRDNKISYEFHNITRYLAKYFDERGITKVIIGKNNGWKTGVSLGKRLNQTFVNIPFNKLIHQLTYKCNLLGIEVVEQEESYTSKASFLDGDALPVHTPGQKFKFSGKRVHRGLYQTGQGRKINADVNGAYNIMVKNDINNIIIKREELLFSPIKIKKKSNHCSIAHSQKQSSAIHNSIQNCELIMGL